MSAPPSERQNTLRSTREPDARVPGPGTPPATLSTPATSGRPAAGQRSLLLAALLSGALSTLVALAGVGVPATQNAAAAVDEPQYLLSAISLVEDGDLDISDERVQGRARPFHPGPLPVQTAVQSDGGRISPHDPLLPLMLAPAVAVAPALGLPAWVGAKALMALLGGAVAAATVWLLVTRWEVRPVLAGAVAVAAGVSPPLAVYGHQVYPEIAAALAVLVAVGAIVPPHRPGERSAPHTVAAGAARRAVRPAVLVLAVSALPWLAAKYTLVAAALAAVGLLRMARASRRLAAVTAAALALSAVGWLVVHRLVYGGWTAYAAGDHFQSRGEFSAVGFDPDLLGRSTRWVALFVDQGYGLVAWQPAWLLVVPAVGLLWGLTRPVRSGAPAPGRSRGGGATSPPRSLPALLAPLAAGLLTAVYVALTMHGFWWPGRQVVVVLPLAAMLIALALSHPALPHRRRWATGA
ncbi:MAG TPA: hypothetical protein VJ976_03165, partial [Ornithinimicrobium sp.]|nr:hypothetical protein [Ornithinimicrobium sp.]